MKSRFPAWFVKKPLEKTLVIDESQQPTDRLTKLLHGNAAPQSNRTSLTQENLARIIDAKALREHGPDLLFALHLDKIPAIQQ